MKSQIQFATLLIVLMMTHSLFALSMQSLSKENYPYQKTMDATVPAFIMTVAGQDFTNTQPPLIVALKSGSTHWVVQTIRGLPANGRFLGASCTGSGASAVCVAAGQTYDKNQPPLLVVSTDGGHSWRVPAIKNTLPRRFYFKNVNCTTLNRSPAICIATGHNPLLNVPLLITSTDGGNHWAIPSMPNLPGYFFTNASCTGVAHSAICILGATYQDDSQLPLLLVSTDGSQHFGLRTCPEMPKEGFLMGTSCTGTGPAAICVAVGKDITHHRPLLIVSTHGSDEWTIKAISGPKIDGFFTSVSCTGTGPSALCMAVGADITHHLPLLAVSTDGGENWACPTIPGNFADGILNSVSCKGVGNTSICIAAGENLKTYSPLLIASNDGGEHWKIQNALQTNIKGQFLQTSCAIDHDIAVCIAAGENFTTSSPLLIQSIHHLDGWVMPTIAGLPLKGAFYGTGATI